MNIDDVLSGRAGANGIRRFLLFTTANKALADQLRALLVPGAALRGCRLSEVRFKPGREITAYYDSVVDTESPERHHIRPIAVTWRANAHVGPQEETVAYSAIQAEATRRGVAAPFRQLMADLPEWSMQIRVSPLDARFTQLPRLSDPRYVPAMLADARASGAAAQDRRQTSDFSIASIKYRPGRRHVLRYDPRNPAGGGAVFAKLYIGEDEARAFRREDGARTFRAAREVADWLAERGGSVHCLRPLAYVAEDAVVLYPRLCGVPLSDCTWRVNQDTAQWLHRAGAALCTLHRLPVALASRPEPDDLATEIRSILQKSHPVAVLMPPVASAIEALCDRARELHDRLPQEPPTFTHGDLKSEHIWAAAGGIAVTDLGSSRLGDPALDVGYFLADWQFTHAAWPPAGLEKMRQSFLAGYGPGVPKERLIRARLCEAVELVKCAVRRVQLFEHDWASRTAGLVERAQAALNDLQSALGIPFRSPHFEGSTQRHETKIPQINHPFSPGAVDYECG